MSRWLDRNHLKLTRRGERVTTALIGFCILGGCGTAFFLEGLIKSTIGA